MAEQLAGLGGALQGTVTGALNQGQSFMNRIFPPEQRADLWARFNAFATERPKLAAFLLSHIAISGIPLGLFILMTVTVAIFSIIAALLVGLLGALLFIVFAVGVALLILLPTLFFTTLVATFLFLWGMGAYYVLKWFNEKKIPGIHTGFVEGLEGIKGDLMGTSEDSENDKLGALNPDGQKALGSGEDTNGPGDKGETRERTKTERKEEEEKKKHGIRQPAGSPRDEQSDTAKTTATEGQQNGTNTPKNREIPKLGSKES